MITVPLDGRGPAEAGAVEIRGAVEVERTAHGCIPRRLGAVARSQVPDDFMRQTSAENAGIRLAFRSAASALELEVTATKMVPDATQPVPPSVYELVVDGAIVQAREGVAGSRYLFSFDEPVARVVPGPRTVVRFGGLGPAEKEFELWLPYTDAVELHALRADAAILPPEPARGVRWLHHGSSISHGYRAGSTLGTWPVVAARDAGVELTSLAFSGSAMLDQLTARTMRDAPADLISLKIGINIVNGDVMRLRAFRTAVHGFLDTIRDGHPSVPLLVISPIFCEPVEECAGPTVQDPTRPYEWSIAGGTAADVLAGKLSLRVIRAELEAIVQARSATDPALHYLDGLALYGPADAASMPLPDNLHPGPDVQRLIGERFAAGALRALVGEAAAVAPTRSSRANGS